MGRKGKLMEEKKVILYNWIYNEYHEKIGVVTCQKGDCPSRLKIGWALAVECGAKEKSYDKVKNIPSIVRAVEGLKETLKIPQDARPRGYLTYIEEILNTNLPSQADIPCNPLRCTVTGKANRESMILLALARGNYDSWNYYCPKDLPYLDHCDLRNSVICFRNYRKVNEEEEHNREETIVEPTLAKLMRQIIRKVERRGFKYFNS